MVHQCQCGKSWEDYATTTTKKCPICRTARGMSIKDRPWDLLKYDGYRKTWLINRRGHKCQSCKRKTWKQKSIPLQLHHVDGNSDNSSQENLELLCPNCHFLTGNFGGANRYKFDTKRSRWMRSRRKSSMTRPAVAA